MSRAIRHFGLIWPAALSLVLGCERTPPAGPAPAAPAGLRLSAESKTWTADEAAARLADPEQALSAAVQLLNLSRVAATWLPPPRSDTVPEGVRVIPLGGGGYAIGLDAEDGQHLAEPLLISSGAEIIRPLAEGHSAAQLRVARDPEVFPHLLIGPGQVQIVLPEGGMRPALVLLDEPAVWFELRLRNRYPYVALLAWQGAGARTIAEYRWDPFEQAFFGPSAVRGGWPVEGWVWLDLEESAALEPIGVLEDPRQKVPQDDPTPYVPDKQRARDPV